jgi:hypothetical protein
MALSGTLKDFSYSDILQLIGQQQKTGSLALRQGTEEVDILFVEGAVVFAADKNRKSSSFLGTMLAQAGVVDPEKLEEALQLQSRSLKRLGDILLELDAIRPDQLSQMARLQTTETLYALFAWTSGTYEFTARDIDASKNSFKPIRAESILLEGFRRADEWPAIRQVFPTNAATLRRLRELPVADLPSLDNYFALPRTGDEEEPEGAPTLRHKLLYRLCENGRTLQQVCNLSRFGDFEALRLLQKLVEWGLVAVDQPPEAARSAMAELAFGVRMLANSGLPLQISIAAVVAAILLSILSTTTPGFGAPWSQRKRHAGAAARLIGRDQLLRIEGALEVYRLEHGDFPTDLQALVDGQLLQSNDLSYPHGAPYFYRKGQAAFVLLPPLH